MKTRTFVEVEVVKEWTDRGDTPWVRIKFVHRDGEHDFDVKPEEVVRLTQTLVEMPL